jgi:hypothetical protein
MEWSLRADGKTNLEGRARLYRLLQNSGIGRGPHVANPVPKGRLKIAQDEILGTLQSRREVPKGRLKIAQDEILGTLQSRREVP